MWGRGNRYERRSRARARRVQRRLEQVQRSRGVRGRPGSLAGQLQPQRRRSSRSLRAGIFAVSLLFGSLIAQGVMATVVEWWNERPLVLAKVAVQGTSRLRGADVARATGLAPGTPLRGLSERELADRVEAHPWVREARVAVLPTGTVIVEVAERVPRAVLRDASGDRFVDAGGVAFAPVEPAEAADAAALPLLSGDGAEASLREGLAVADGLAGRALPGLASDSAPHRGLELALPAAGDGAREGFVLRGSGGIRVILGGDDVAAVRDRIERLERLLAADLGELEETEAIDMRFAGQAVLRRRSASR